MPPAARITDFHACPMVTPGTPPIPHVGGPIIKGQPNVLTGKLPQARISDMCVCVGPPDVIIKGSSGVFVGKLPAARIGDNTAHGGAIVVGMPTVIIGETKAGGGGGGAPVMGVGMSDNAYTGGAAAAMFAAQAAEQARALVDAALEGAPFCEICFAAAQAAAAALAAAAQAIPQTLPNPADLAGAVAGLQEQALAAVNEAQAMVQERVAALAAAAQSEAARVAQHIGQVSEAVRQELMSKLGAMEQQMEALKQQVPAELQQAAEQAVAEALADPTVQAVKDKLTGVVEQVVNDPTAAKVIDEIAKQESVDSAVEAAKAYGEAYAQQVKDNPAQALEDGQKVADYIKGL
jgi:uncharacterized Zn-binding protein involved in type VI secretion